MADGPVTIELQRWDQVRDAFRSKALRQAGYSQGAIITADTLLDLHGTAHRDRRRLENRLFRREVFSYWEHEVLGSTIAATLDPFVRAGAGDLAQIGYRAALSLTALIAGVDHDPADAAATEELYAIVKKFSEAATLMHSTRDKDEVRAEVVEVIRIFEAGVYAASLSRRRTLVERCRAGEIDIEQLPKDVLTTLLLNEDRLELTADVLLREICLYLQAGAHSTANAFTHTIDDLFAWGDTHPADLELATRDVGFVQRCMHESLRLHPASPMAYRTPLEDVLLSDGTRLPAGSIVVLNLSSANRDVAVFGPRAAEYDPHREVPDGLARWGMSFGAGTHRCIGAELDGGLEILDDRSHAQPLYGTVAVMGHAFLRAGGRRDPVRPPTLDPASTRKHFSSYPVLFGPAG